MHAGCGHRAVEAVQALARWRGTSLGPWITPMRRWPSDSRCSVASRAPEALDAETAGMPSSSVHARVDDHERVALAPQHLELLVRLLGEHQHGAVGGAVHEPVEQRNLALVVVQRRAQHHAHVLLVERLGGACEDGREVGRLDDREHHADQAGAAARERPRAAVGGEAVIAHDAQHGAARLGRDAGPLVEHARDGRDRDAGRAGDLADRRAGLAALVRRCSSEPLKQILEPVTSRSATKCHLVLRRRQ